MRILLFFALTLCSVLCDAQTVRILSVRGDVRIRLDNKDVHAKTGLVISRSTPITLGTDGSISLISSNGEMAELSGHVVTTPAKEFARTVQSTSTQRIAKYLWSNLVNNSATGVEQGTVYRSHEIQVLWPPAMSLDSPLVELRWRPLSSMDRHYVVSLYDDADSLLESNDVRDTFLVLDLNRYRVQLADRCVYWTVQLAGILNSATEPRCLQVLSAREIGALQEKIADAVPFSSAEEGRNSPLVMIVIAAVLEEYGLYDRALDYYSQAYEMAPSEDYHALAQKCRLRGLGD